MSDVIDFPPPGNMEPTRSYRGPLYRPDDFLGEPSDLKRHLRDVEPANESWLQRFNPIGSALAADMPRSMTAAQIDLPPEADAFVNRVRKVEGTLGGSGYVKYGGEEFKPSKDFPQWEGAMGPTGEKTHAAGPGQWQPNTWKEQKEKFKGYGLDLDFSNEQHQKAAIWDKGYEEYKKATGRDLREDLKTNKVEWAKLSGTWQGFEPRVTRTDKPGGRIDENAIAYEQSRPHQSVWYVDPKEMLGLLPDIPPEEEAPKRQALMKSLAERGEPIFDIPHVELSGDGEHRKITDFDGRNRLRAMADAGLTAVPVVLKGVEPGVRPVALEGMTGKRMPLKFDPVPNVSRETLRERMLHQGPAQMLAEAQERQSAETRHIETAKLAAQPPDTGASQLPPHFSQLYNRPGQPQFFPDLPGAAPPEIAARPAVAPTTAPAPPTNALRGMQGEAQNVLAEAERARQMPLMPERGPPPLERITPEEAALAKDALDRGFPVTGPQTPARQVGMERALAKNVSNTFGEDAPALTPEVLSRPQKRIGDGLNRIEQGHRLPFDSKFRAEMHQIEQDAESELTTEGQIRVVKKGVHDVMVDPVKTEAAKKAAQAAPKTTGKPAAKPKEVLRGGLSGEQFANLIHEGGPINKLANHAEDGVAVFGQRIEDAVRDLLQRRLSPEEAAEYQGLRYQYKNLKVAEKAADAVGKVDPGKLSTAVKRSFPNWRTKVSADRPPPELAKLSDIANTFVKKTPAEPANRNATRRIAEVAVGASLGHMVGGPFGAVAGAAAALGGEMAIRNALRPRLTESLINRALQSQPPPGARNRAINALMARSGAMSLATPPAGGNALNSLMAPSMRQPAGGLLAPQPQQMR